MKYASFDSLDFKLFDKQTKRFFVALVLSMDCLNEEQKRLIIGQFYQFNRDRGKRFTVLHFMKMKLHEKTIYRIINRIDNNMSLKRSKGSGRKQFKMSHKHIESLIYRVDGKKGVSQKKLALKYKICQQYVSRIIIWSCIKYYRRQNKQKTTEKQNIIIKQRLNRLSKTSFRPLNGLSIVIDDESYFTFSGENIPGNDGFYSSDRSSTSCEIKYKSKEKFPPKIMVWIAISEKGKSQAFIAKKNCSINANVYSKECFIKRLKPLINKHHSDGKYIFWPDLASSHYAKTTIETFNKLNISYVKRCDNPSNCPQLRPIERFWAQLKAKVYMNDWKAKNIDHLRNRIRTKLREFCPEDILNLIRNCKTKIRKASDLGHEYMFN